jgi:hypothetical protein
MRQKRILLFAVLCLLIPVFSLYPQTLEKIREEVRKEEKEETYTKDNGNGQGKDRGKHKGWDKQKEKGKGNGYEKDTDTAGDSIADLEVAEGVFLTMAYVVTSPFWVPYNAWDKDIECSHFSDYPYSDSTEGYMTGLSGDITEPLKKTAVRLSVEDGYDFEGINSLNMDLLVSTTSRVGFESGISYLTEKTDDFTYDSLFLGDINVIWRFVQSERLQMRTGIGVRFMNDSEGHDTGFNFTYGADFYPQKPLVISASIDYGKLGSANVSHGRCSLGWIAKGWEVYGGYSALKVEDIKVHGPVAGLRYWF